MELCLYIADLALLSDLDELLRPAQPEPLSKTVFRCLFRNADSHEYLGHLLAVDTLLEISGGEPAFTRLYFGQEFCEHLIPTPKDLIRALHTSYQLGWAFTYTTGVLTDSGLERVRRNLDTLLAEHDRAGAATGLEVVANDWGLLDALAQDYPQAQPVLGRLLVKQKRLARFTDAPPTPDMGDLDASPEQISQAQLQAWSSLNLTVPSYREELAGVGVARVDLDIVPQGVHIEPEAWNLAFGCYYPWAYLTSGRNCATAGLVDPVRQHVPLDAPCPRPCRELNASVYGSYGSGSPLLHRGTAVFTFAAEYAAPYLDGTVPVDRLIFEPYAPV